MALLSILFGRLPGLTQKTISILPVDVFTQEVITLTSEVTDHPVESGGVVTDHIFNQPTQLRVTGAVRAQLRGLAYNVLTTLHERRQPVFVVTGLQTFRQMAIVSLDIPREARTASSFQFSAEFKQLTFVSSQVTEAPAQASASNTAAPTNAAGNNTTRASPPASVTAAADTQAATSGPQSGSRGSLLSQAFGG